MKRILFANIGWMEHYKGNSTADMIVGGGNYDDKDKHEAFNFQDSKGKCYGYVQTVRNGRINLSRIVKPIAKSEKKVDKVLVVWVAKRPDCSGTYIVGWYHNAMVYADYRSSNDLSRNKYGYNIVANKADCVLLPVDARTMNVPRATSKGKGYLGQSNVWYADYDSPQIQSFRKTVIDYINKYKAKKNTIVKYQVKVDAEARKKVEKAAVKYVTDSYTKLGFNVTSREKDNVGWDLDAKNGEIYLRLEVKGLANSIVNIHITSNEYEKMMREKKYYRLCVVINAITHPQMIVFLWDNLLKQWVSEDDSNIVLSIDLKPSYIACVK